MFNKAFITKILDKIVVEHFQSVYQKHNSRKSALAKVVHDLLLASDMGGYIFCFGIVGLESSISHY